MEKSIISISVFAAILGGIIAYYNGGNPIVSAMLTGLLVYVIIWGIISLFLGIVILKASTGLAKLLFWR